MTPEQVEQVQTVSHDTWAAVCGDLAALVIAAAYP